MTTVVVSAQTQIIDAPIVQQEISVDPNTSEVTFVITNETPIAVINAGPQGPAGVGGTASNYFHTQTVASTSWVINHGLGFRPSVDAFEEDGSSVEGHIIYHTLNQVEIQFLSPRAGTARLS